MKKEDYLNASRRMLFINEDSEFEYSGLGTVFLCYYKGKLYAITAGHVTEDYTANQAAIMIHPECRKFLTQACQFTLNHSKTDDTSHCDLTVFEIKQNDFCPSEFRDCPPFNLTDGLIKSKPPSGGRIVVRGYPGNQNLIKYEDFEIRAQATIVKGESIDEVIYNSCHQFRIVNYPEEFNNYPADTVLNGLSGSPVFWFNDENPPTVCHFLGVLIMATFESKIAHYIDGEVVKHVLEALLSGNYTDIKQ